MVSALDFLISGSILCHSGRQMEWMFALKFLVLLHIFPVLVVCKNCDKHITKLGALICSEISHQNKCYAIGLIQKEQPR